MIKTKGTNSVKKKFASKDNDEQPQDDNDEVFLKQNNLCKQILRFY